MGTEKSEDEAWRAPRNLDSCVDWFNLEHEQWGSFPLQPKHSSETPPAENEGVEQAG